MPKHVVGSLVALIVLGGQRVASPQDAQGAKRLRSRNSVRLIRDVPYADRGEGSRLKADVYLPNEEGPLPTILMIHGGAWFSGNKAHVGLHAQFAAQQGYAVVAVNYRLAPKHRFPAQLEDCQAALRWIQGGQHAYPFHGDRIATYGYSAGAHLACLLGLQDAEPTRQSGSEQGSSARAVKAIVAGGTPCEFSWIPAERETLAYWLGGSRSQLPDLYRRASPLSHVDEEDPPVYLFHGEHDRLVPLQSPQKLQRALQALQVEVHLDVVARRGHMGTFLHREARERAVAFLDQKLKGRALR